MTNEVAFVARNTRQLNMVPNKLAQAWGMLFLSRWPCLHFLADASGLAEIDIGVAADF